MPGFGEKFSKFASNTKKQAQEMVETNKLNSAIHKEEAAVQTAYAQIGKCYFDTYMEDQGIPANLRQMLDEVLAHLHQIEEMKAKIVEVQGNKMCPQCGTVIETDKLFCSKCGYRFEAQPENVPMHEPAAYEYQATTPEPEITEPAEEDTQGTWPPVSQGTWPSAAETAAPIQAKEKPAKFCTSCGSLISEGKLFCGNCGQKQE